MTFALHANLFTNASSPCAYLYVTSSRGRDEGWFYLANVNGEIQFEKKCSSTLSDHFTLDAQYAKKNAPDSFNESLTAGLTQQAISITLWHELSDNGSKDVRSIAVSPSTALMEVHITGGKVVYYKGESIAKSVFNRELFFNSSSARCKEALTSLAALFAPFTGTTVLHALWNSDTNTLIVIDIRRLSDIWLTLVPRTRRNRIVEALLGSSKELSKSVTYLDPDRLYKGRAIADDTLADSACYHEDKILAINLDNQDGNASDYYWVDPESIVAYRVLSIQEIQPSSFRYGLGLICEKTGDEVLTLSLSSPIKANPDDVVGVSGYISLNHSSEEVLELTHAKMLPLINTHSHANSSHFHRYR